MYTFTAVIEATDQGGAFVTVPFDVEATFGSKRPRVQATFDGLPYRGSLVRMGGSEHILIVRKAIREQLSKQPGDAVEVTVVSDTEPREVTLPKELASALNADARSFFDSLSYTHQREYVEWIEGAKRPETRARRIGKAVAMLQAGQKAR